MFFTGDTVSLEILMKNGADQLVVLEVWQFRLDTEDNLLRRGRLPCSKVVANHSGLQPAISFPSLATSPSPALSPNDPTAAGAVEQQPYFAVQDFRRSRLFERLGSLLKSLLVTTRMLPGLYSLCLRQHFNYKVIGGREWGNISFLDKSSLFCKSQQIFQ